MKISRPRHRLVRSLAARLLTIVALATAGIAAPVSAPAHAAPGDLICDANAQINFTPPLTSANTTADGDIAGALVNCVSLNGRYPDLDSAVLTGSGEATALSGVPCALALTIEATVDVEWLPGNEDSELTAVLNTNPLAGTITLEIAVTDGELEGDTVTPVPVGVTPNIDCALHGLKSLSSALAVLAFS